jgi:translation initiation factor 2 subunit 1
MGAYVSLLEYNDIEGMILLSELSRRRIRSISKLIRVGRQEVGVVLRVDQEKGYIDLSKRRVSAEDVVKCEEKFNKSKAVHSILRHVSETVKIRLEELYKMFGWDLYKRYGHAYDAFKLAVAEPNEVLGRYNLQEALQDAVIKNVQRRMTPQPVKVRADLELSCFSYEGIDAIKEALRAGEKLSSDDMQIKIKLVAPPLYVVMTTAMDKELGISRLTESIKAIEATIKAKGGDLSVKNPPRAVSERDDKLLSALMETLEKQNLEVGGDDDADPDD